MHLFLYVLCICNAYRGIKKEEKKDKEIIQTFPIKTVMGMFSDVTFSTRSYWMYICLMHGFTCQVVLV